MTLLLRRGLVVAALVAALAAPGPAAADPVRQQAAHPIAHADHDLIAGLAAEYGVDSSDPGPNPNAYLMAVAEAVADWIRERLELLGVDKGLVELLAEIAFWLGITIIVVAIALLIMILVSILRGRPRGLSVAGDGLLVADQVTAAAERDPGACWRDLETALADADPGAALAALWWWFACTVAGPAVGPSWTGVDLLRHAAPRADLVGRFVGRIDTLVYGPGRASVAEVRELALEIKSGLA